MSSRVLVALRIEASPARVFEAFTAEVGEWWRPNGLLRTGRRPGGRLAMEMGQGGRVLEAHPDGSVDEIGRILVWDPPSRLAFTWHPVALPPGVDTEVRVAFEPVGEITRVVVEHLGWDEVPPEHVARRGLPPATFQQRLAEWWADLLAGLRERSTAEG